jgi:hypothetical protein
MQLELMGCVDLELRCIACPHRIICEITIRKIIRHLRAGNAGNEDNANNAGNAGNAGIKSFHSQYFCLIRKIQKGNTPVHKNIITKSPVHQFTSFLLSLPEIREL